MFGFSYAMHNILRRPWKSALAVVVSLVLVSFFLGYFQVLLAVEYQLDVLGRVVPVTAELTNTNGSQNMGLEIPKKTIDALRDNEFVSQPVYTLHMPADIGQPKNPASYAVNVIGINSFDAFPLLDPAQMSFTPACEQNEFWQGQAVCIAQEDFLLHNGFDLGNEIELSVYHSGYQKDNPYMGDPQLLGTASLKIIASFRPRHEDITSYPDLIVPIFWSEAMYTQANKPFVVNSFRFTVADPLALNTFKAQMTKLGLKEINLQAPFDREGRTLTVNDELFIQTAQQLLSNRKLYRTAVPTLIAIAVVIGFVSSTLLMQSRRHEFVIMRSLGAKKSQCISLLMLEFALLSLAGCLLSVLGALVLSDLSALTVLCVCVVVFFCYMVGALVTLFLLGHLNLMRALKQND